MRRNLIRSAALALALVLALTGCEEMVLPYGQNAPDRTSASDGDSDKTDGGQSTALFPTGEGYTRADSVFSINYNPKGSLDPLTSTDYYNDQIFGLMYEGLFALSPDLKPEPVLCESFVTEDGITYDLTLRRDVRFHDGSLMTSADAVYSLNTARRSEKYSSRLDGISSVSALDDITVRIKLKSANFMFPALLDTPVIKESPAQTAPRTGDAEAPEDTETPADGEGAGEGEDAPSGGDAPASQTASGPLGTGPYRMSDGRLVAFMSHRDYTPASLQVIYLREVETGDLADSFADRSVDLVGYDSTGNNKLNIHMVHETRYYDTTDLVYLGFNCRDGATEDQYVRQALMRLVNLDVICSDVYENAARRSVFVLNPALGLVSDLQEAGYGYSRQNFTRLALTAGLEDRDEDGFLEYYGDPMALRFIVNSENTAKVEAAERIVSDMLNMGVNVSLAAMPFSSYQRALQSGSFDLYLAEVRLKADFDLSALLCGKLNFGGINAPDYQTLIRAFLAAPDEESRARAALELDLYVAEDAGIVPIAYKQRSVLTHVGVVTGLEPSQSNIYRNVLNWKVDLENR